MNILCIGDVVGDAGVTMLCKKLPSLKKELCSDICIVNGENSDKTGTGLTRHGAEAIFSHGADVITTGNHCFRRTNEDFYTENEFALCPVNYPYVDSKAGCCVLDMGSTSVAVINMLGVAFLEPVDNPFKAADSLLKKIDAKIKIIDFHAESTAEKLAFAYYLDGKVSAVFGTHTHVQTADEQILPLGTGYITDAGMTGPRYSVIGVNPQNAIEKQSRHTPVKFEVAQGECIMGGVLFTINSASGKCEKVQRINISE